MGFWVSLIIIATLRLLELEIYKDIEHVAIKLIKLIKKAILPKFVVNTSVG